MITIHIAMPHKNFAIIQRGPANTGKSTTIRLFYERLQAAYPEAKIAHEAGGSKDFRVIVTIEAIRIGIESLGDPGQKRQRESLRLFVQQNCHAIICASRTSGGTVDTVEELEGDGYEILWRDRERAAISSHAHANQQEATWMLQEVRSRLGL